MTKEEIEQQINELWDEIQANLDDNTLMDVEICKLQSMLEEGDYE